MRKLQSLLLLSVAALLAAGCARHGASSLIDHVDPLIGTGPARTPSALRHSEKLEAYAQVVPAVTMPFGMTNWTPQTRDTETKCHAPYYYTDSLIQGFRATHWLSGSCTQDYGSFTIMPLAGALRFRPEARASRFSHTRETAAPDYYRVLLEEHGIEVEMTATTRCGLFSFTFAGGDSAHILLQPNSDEGLGYVRIDPGRNEIAGYNPVHRIYQGTGKPAGISGYFVVQFDRAFANWGVYTQEVPCYHQSSVNAQPEAGAFVSFAPAPGQKVMARVGTSFTSIAAARRNLEAEIPDWDFARTRRLLRQEWNRLLGRIKIEGASSTEMTRFYTAFYHCLQQPRIVSDVDGSYPGFAADSTIHKTAGFDYYDDFSLWDTYRALHPLYTLLFPEKSSNMMRSLLLKAEQGGWLPIFPMWSSYTSAMIGDHAIAVLGDAWIKGIRGFDIDRAYACMRRNAFDSPRDSSDYKDGMGRRALASYRRYGFIPLEDPVPYAFHDGEQVSRTLEYGYDDFVLAQVARQLGKTADYDTLSRRALGYRKVFDAAAGYVRGRHADGRWAEAFVPTARMPYITEGTPQHYTWYVPHDIAGLIGLMGGESRFNDRLDTLFTSGQYWHGNEPCHQIPYLYCFSGRPDRTQELVRQVLHDEYGTGPGGLSGNDDSGQMSAWYIFSKLGFYPVCPGTPQYVIGTPGFARATLHLPNGNKFVIQSLHNGEKQPYIAAVKLNGRIYDNLYLNHADIAAGGRIEFTMSGRPSPVYGKARTSRPFSMSE
ncbi:MAG TPA: GH92 family glycosyl hydrolase [bacterium]|nr:GH92 family glycosyl hydrolase [bacterium]HPR87944.1 GH92 family glycosyl hydrolase [bacterium]